LGLEYNSQQLALIILGPTAVYLHITFIQHGRSK